MALPDPISVNESMASIASVLPTEDEVAKAGTEELRRMIADYQNNM